MRPGPAIQAALFVDVLLAFSLRHAMRRAFRNRTQRGVLVSPRALRIKSRTEVRKPHPQRSLKLAAQSFQRGGLSEEAATPKFPQTRHDASFGNLRRFTLENRRKRQLYRNPTALSRHLTSALAILCLMEQIAATENSCRVVHKLCRTEIACGKYRKRGRKCTFLKTHFDLIVGSGTSVGTLTVPKRPLRLSRTTNRTTYFPGGTEIVPS